jgi:hypothetical protein
MSFPVWGTRFQLLLLHEKIRYVEERLVIKKNKKAGGKYVSEKQECVSKR